jgi:hypothetical protein
MSRKFFQEATIIPMVGKYDVERLKIFQQMTKLHRKGTASSRGLMEKEWRVLVLSVSDLLR